MNFSAHYITFEETIRFEKQLAVKTRSECTLFEQQSPEGNFYRKQRRDETPTSSTILLPLLFLDWDVSFNYGQKILIRPKDLGSTCFKNSKRQWFLDEVHPQHLLLYKVMSVPSSGSFFTNSGYELLKWFREEITSFACNNSALYLDGWNLIDQFHGRFFIDILSIIN